MSKYHWNWNAAERRYLLIDHSGDVILRVLEDALTEHDRATILAAFSAQPAINQPALIKLAAVYEAAVKVVVWSRHDGHGDYTVYAKNMCELQHAVRTYEEAK